MSSLLCALFWALMVLLLPALLFAWVTETDRERAHRLRRGGWSQQRIATHLGLSRWKVRRLLC